MSHIKTAVFPVAGLGTRFLPATKAMPKEMLTLVDRPLIQYAVEEARASGIERFIFVSAPGKQAIESHFTPASALETALKAKGNPDLLDALATLNLPEGALNVVHQSHPLGLGHAVRCARRLIGDEAFAVILPDDVIAADRPCLAQMIRAHSATAGNMVATMEVGPSEISSYGALAVAETHGRLTSAKGVVEKPRPGTQPSNLAVIGRYILQPSIMDQLLHIVPGAGGEIQLTDAIAADIEASGLWGFRFDGERFDCGSKLGFLEATLAFGMNHAELGADFTASVQRRLPKEMAHAA